MICSDDVYAEQKDNLIGSFNRCDRGDTYVKRHYFEFETTDGRIAVVYFDRQARPHEPRWHLYTIESP